MEALAFTFVFLMRRLAFAYTICHIDRNITIQVFILDCMSTCVLCYYLSVRPMENAINNFVHIFNEIAILTCIWSLFLFTNYVPDPVLRHKFGWWYLYFLAFNFFVNFIVLIYSLITLIIRDLKRYCKKRVIKRWIRKARLTRQEDEA